MNNLMNNIVDNKNSFSKVKKNKCGNVVRRYLNNLRLDMLDNMNKSKAKL